MDWGVNENRLSSSTTCSHGPTRSRGLRSRSPRGIAAAPHPPADRPSTEAPTANVLSLQPMPQSDRKSSTSTFAKSETDIPNIRSKQPCPSNNGQVSMFTRTGERCIEQMVRQMMSSRTLNARSRSKPPLGDQYTAPKACFRRLNWSSVTPLRMGRFRICSTSDTAAHRTGQAGTTFSIASGLNDRSPSLFYGQMAGF